MTQRIPFIVAIDGPAGSGKSSLSKLISEKLGWTYLNTGNLYRLIAYLAQKHSIDFKNEEELAKLIRQTKDDIVWRKERFFYKGQDVSEDLHSEVIGNQASTLAGLPMVRDLLLPIQRTLALQAPKGVLIDGRDIGTVVFPKADLKIFMTADLTARAERRYKQLVEKNVQPLPAIKELIEVLRERDRQDAGRAVAPLRRAADAIDFDTSSMSIEETAEELYKLIRKNLAV
ncbi:MAG: (d)CMP kinase [Deltaproteobacteria bacterium]|nr:(d)CMP kinase [Deltaproteobacteria bacterium]